jgi:hypothetical protein
MNELNLIRTLQIAFATVAGTLIQQQMKIANLENLLIANGLAQEADFIIKDLRDEAKIDQMMQEFFPELIHLPDLFDNV